MDLQWEEVKRKGGSQERWRDGRGYV